MPKLGSHYTKLTSIQRIKVYEWLKTNATQEQLDETKHTVESLAKAAEGTLKFTVPATSIEPLLKVLEVKTRIQRSQSEPNPKNITIDGAILDNVLAEIGSLRNNVIQQGRLLESLYIELGKTYPK